VSMLGFSGPCADPTQLVYTPVVQEPLSGQHPTIPWLVSYTHFESLGHADGSFTFPPTQPQILAFESVLFRSSDSGRGTLVGRGFQSAGAYEAVGSGPECGRALVKENIADRRSTREEDGILNRLISIIAKCDDERQRDRRRGHKAQEAETYSRGNRRVIKYEKRQQAAGAVKPPMAAITKKMGFWGDGFDGCYSKQSRMPYGWSIWIIHD